MKYSYGSRCLVLVLTILLASVAQGAALRIDDSIEGEISMHHSPDWEFPVTSNGVVFPAKTGGATTVPGETGTFSGAWLVNEPGQPDPGEAIIYIVEEMNPWVVSDIIKANWSTSGMRAEIFFEIQSSACGENLGLLPAAFEGLAVVEPDATMGLNLWFRDPVTTDQVFIPSNLAVYFAPPLDQDCDGVPNSEDMCSHTVIPEATVPASGELNPNHWALLDDDWVFDTVTMGRGQGAGRTFTTEDTRGCSCEQIIAAMGLGKGHTRYGCSSSVMEEWIENLP